MRAHRIPTFHFWIAIWITALFAGSCATTTPYNPFKVPREEIYRRTRVIALAPVTIPKDLVEDPGPVKKKFESLIETKLREAGFSVLPSQEHAKILEKMTDQAGGTFDPITGKRDDEKYKKVRAGVLRELRTHFNADALLIPHIIFVKAAWNVGTARWHGVSESIRPAGIQVLETLVGVSSYGTVGALSLLVTLEGHDGAEQYRNAGGIQVLAKMTATRQVAVVPRNELFADEEKNRQAVEIALAPLLGKPLPQGESQSSTEEPK